MTTRFYLLSLKCQIYFLWSLRSSQVANRGILISMQKSCSQCGEGFEITDRDTELLAKISPTFSGKTFSIPTPTFCFDCRLQRRLAFYNARSLYRRTCDLTEKSIVSVYSPDKPWKVYEKDAWYSDQWDPLSFGRDVDLTKSFLEQFEELMHDVPLPSLSVLGGNVNSEYTNDNLHVKNSYLIFDGEQAENGYYGHTFVKIKDSMDFLHLNESELCYECIHCYKGYNLFYCSHSHNCSDSWFLQDCIGCKNCFGCVNLRQKEYCIFNEQKTKEEYRQFMKQ